MKTEVIPMRISISKIRMFKSCRRAYELHYVEGLTPIDESSALRTGRSFHEKVERFNTTGELDTDDLSKESAMLMAYVKYVAPMFTVINPEEWASADLKGGHTLVGRVDGIAEDGCLVEYKTTSSTNLDEYEYSLAWDEQIPAYMFLTGKRKVHYVICRKPNIRQKKDESDEEFFERMCNWFDEDHENKIKVLDITLTDEDVMEFERNLYMMLRQMCEAECVGAFYRNEGNCFRWGRMCEYAPVCLNYDPNEVYVGFEKEASEHGN